MIDFKLGLISLLEEQIPELRDKIQVGAVDAGMKVPYAVISIPEEIPIRTIHGIAGYNIVYNIFVAHDKISELEQVKNAIIRSLDSAKILNKKSTYKSGEYEYFSDYDVHSYVLTFKLL